MKRTTRTLSTQTAPHANPSGQASRMEQLRACGLRPTMARLATLLALQHASAQPLCFYELSRRLQPFGIQASASTIQRVLTELEGCGLVGRDVSRGRSVYWCVG